MALADEVTARVSTQRLVELTNPDSAPATTVDTTRLGYACTDAAAEFEARCSVVYDNTNAKHVLAAVAGTIYYLLSYRVAETEELRRAETKWRELTEAIALVTGNNRVSPQTTSVLQPNPESTVGEIVRPDVDRENLRGLVPNPPGRGPHLGLASRETP